MVDGRERETESGVQVCVCVCESVCGCCFVVWRTLWSSSRVQILIGYEPKGSFIPWLLEVIYSPKLEVFFVLEIFCVCV
jgi:hypothetical protein